MFLSLTSLRTTTFKDSVYTTGTKRLPATVASVQTVYKTSGTLYTAAITANSTDNTDSPSPPPTQPRPTITIYAHVMYIRKHEQIYNNIYFGTQTGPSRLRTHGQTKRIYLSSSVFYTIVRYRH